jgi:hypothetical protein
VKTLARGQMCPIHKSFFCCGRVKVEPREKKGRVYTGPGTRRIEDPHHPRGYRELCSKAEMTRRKMRLLARSQECFYCHEKFTDFREIVVAHIEPKGMGGARHDDHFDNLAVSCADCNLENGSRRP